MNWNVRNVIRYVRELSIVIAGIAITFMASDWFSSRKEKKELERSLEAVKIELQENLEVIKNYAEFYEESELLSLYLNSTNKKDLNLDSLQRLNAKQNYDISTRIITVIYKTSAFEMLKTSGNMRLIKDANLSRSILDCYTSMEIAKQQNDVYMERKWDVLTGTFIRNEVNRFDFFDPRFSEVVNFLSIITRTHQTFKECVWQIEDTLELF